MAAVRRAHLRLPAAARDPPERPTVRSGPPAHRPAQPGQALGQSALGYLIVALAGGLWVAGFLSARKILAVDL